MIRRRLMAGFLSALFFGTACGTSGSTAGTGTSCPVSAPASGLLTAGTLTFGSDISYPPQESNPNNPVGFDVDIGAQIAKEMCLQSKFVNQGFDGIIPALDANKFDAILSAMTINDTRKQKVDFVAYFNAGESLVVKKGSNLTFSVLTDLCGHTVAVENGTAEADEVKTIQCPAGKSVQASAFPTDTEAIQQLRKGTVDTEFTDSPVAAYDVKQNPDFVLGSPVLEIAPEGIAVRKGDTVIETAINAAFEKMKSDGTYDSILAKWGLQGGDIRKA